MSNSGTGRPSRRQFVRGAAVIGAAGLGGGLSTACGTGKKSGPGAGRQGKAGKTLFFAGLQWGTPTNFNPLGAPSPGWPCGNNHPQYVYETLLRYNLLGEGTLEPGLATQLREVDRTTFELPIQPAATWHDGKPLTVDDVVYTFELARRHEALIYSVIWDYLQAVEKKDDSTIVFRLDPKQLNPGMVKAQIATTAIIPKHVWEAHEKSGKALLEVTNLEPVGSGPYQLDHHNAQEIGLKRFDDYWGKEFYGGLPEPKFLVHQIFKDNGGGDLALEQNNVDVSQQFTPQIWKMWKVKDLPVSTWYKKQPYHIPGGMPMFVINTTKKGLDNPKVRRAMAFAIDYARIAEVAMSRYSDPAQSSIVLPGGPEEKFFDKQAVQKNGWSYDPKRTRQILEEELGATKGEDGVYQLPDGTRLGGWTMQTPSGWGDWQVALKIVAENLKQAGFDVSTKFPQAPTVTTSVQNGNFELALWSVASTVPATPWQRFRDVLDDRDVPDVGSQAFWNYGRFTHPEVAGLLETAAAAESEASAVQAYSALDRIFMDNAPMIPLMYRPVQFFEFNETTWKGFPTAKDPYAPPTFSGAGNEWLWKIEHV